MMQDSAPPATETVDLNTADVESLKPVSGIDSEIRAHLRRVFLALTATTAFGGLGCTAYTGLSPAVSILATFALVIYLSMAPQLSDGSHPSMTRLGALLTFGFFEGAAIGGLVKQALEIDASIVVTAFLGTVVIFACFSGAAMYAKRRTYLFMGGYLLSCLLNLVLLSIANLIFHLAIINLLWLYGGLFLFCGFVLYDTTVIIELAHQGSRDYVRHALQLFLDFVNIFVRLLIILSRKRD